MEKQDFSVSIQVPVAAAEVSGKIADVPAWWGVGFEGSAKAQGDKFVIKMGPEAYFNCTVSELVTGKRTVWSVDECYMPWYQDKTEWAGTRMVFDLSEAGGVTSVTFTHEGLVPGVECYGDCAPGWTHWIATSLASYLTTGEGVFRQPTK